MTTKLSENEQCLMCRYMPMKRQALLLHAHEKDMICLLHLQYMAGLLPGIFQSKFNDGEHFEKIHGFSDGA